MVTRYRTRTVFIPARSQWGRACNSTIFLSRRWSAMTNDKKLIWCHCVTGLELPFFQKKKEKYTENRSVCKKCRDIDLVWELHASTHGLLPLSVIVIFITIFFFVFQADKFYCGCVQGYECKPAGYGSYWGKCVEESGSGMGANLISWYPSNRHVYEWNSKHEKFTYLGEVSTTN